MTCKNSKFTLAL